MHAHANKHTVRTHKSRDEEGGGGLLEKYYRTAIKTTTISLSVLKTELFHHFRRE